MKCLYSQCFDILFNKNMKKLLILSLAIFEVAGIQITTPERIKEHGYPVQTHVVQTNDGYILTIFRIPYSPNLNNKNETNKPIVLLSHGMCCSSDSWILNGPNDAIAFMLVDAGYDVWLFNARGNFYSKNHTTLSPTLFEFWNFSWHEIAIFDLPATIDYILQQTQQTSLHYIGHSQGTTIFFVLLSQMPSYNDKIATSYHLSPLAYMNNAQSPLFKLLGPLLGQPSVLATIIGDSEFVPNTWLLHKLGSEICQENSPFLPMCVNILFLLAGWNSTHLNYTLVSDAVDTHPAGCSTRQYIHYIQEYESAHFREYDFDFITNQLVYDDFVPPDYNIHNIDTSKPLYLFCSFNDYISSIKDVERFAAALGFSVTIYKVIYKDFNHIDFMWAIDVKPIINVCIIDTLNKYVNKPFQGDLCKHFLPNNFSQT